MQPETPISADQILIVTPSYRRDLEPCTLMCETVDRFVRLDYRHLLVVPGRDERRFRHLASPRRTIVSVEDYLPVRARRIPVQKERWLLAGLTRATGWIVQQLVKIRAAELAAASGDVRAVAYFDSDICLIQPFTQDHVLQDNKVRFLRELETDRHRHDRNYDKWYRGGCRLLDLPQRGHDGAEYIGPLVTWDPVVAERMCRRIEAVSGQSWAKAAASQREPFGFSEYVTYGLFVDRCDAAAQARLVGAPHSLCHLSTDFDIKSPSGREAFIRSIRPENVAVLIQSNLRLPTEQWRALAKELIQQAATTAP